MNASGPTHPPAFARHWAQELDCKESSLVGLQGGINNRVYRCGEDGRNQWVIKGYAPLVPGARDRMQAEVDFLRYASIAAPGFTPELIQVDTTRRCIIIENLKGQPFPEKKEPPKKAIKAALKFFNQLNPPNYRHAALIKLDAAEGFLSLRGHLVNVWERIGAFDTEHVAPYLKQTAIGIIQRLRLEFDKAQVLLELQLRNDLIEDLLDPRQRCISPSDFGFHNALYMGDKVYFFDFEFAGWDDPAKTVVDFLLQPRTPIARKTNSSVVRLLQRYSPPVAQRASILKPIMKLKWACIILSILNPARLETMKQANPKFFDEVALYEKRFSDALSLLEEI